VKLFKLDNDGDAVYIVPSQITEIGINNFKPKKFKVTIVTEVNDREDYTHSIWDTYEKAEIALDELAHELQDY
jgi:hypothetical protein